MVPKTSPAQSAAGLGTLRSYTYFDMVRRPAITSAIGRSGWQLMLVEVTRRQPSALPQLPPHSFPMPTCPLLQGSCIAGMCSVNTPKPQGTACGVGSACDGAGNCGKLSDSRRGQPPWFKRGGRRPLCPLLLRSSLSCYVTGSSLPFCAHSLGKPLQVHAAAVGPINCHLYSRPGH